MTYNDVRGQNMARNSVM